MDFTNREHLAIMNDLGIVVESMPGGKIQVSHFMQKVWDPRRFVLLNFCVIFSTLAETRCLDTSEHLVSAVNRYTRVERS